MKEDAGRQGERKRMRKYLGCSVFEKEMVWLKERWRRGREGEEEVEEELKER